MGDRPLAGLASCWRVDRRGGRFFRGDVPAAGSSEQDGVSWWSGFLRAFVGLLLLEVDVCVGRCGRAERAWLRGPGWGGWFGVVCRVSESGGCVRGDCGGEGGIGGGGGRDWGRGGLCEVGCWTRPGYAWSLLSLPLHARRPVFGRSWVSLSSYGVGLGRSEALVRRLDDGFLACFCTCL